MKKFPLIPFVFFLGLIVVFFACNQTNKQKSNNETILKGSTSILVDETLLPIIEDQVEVFESLYAGSKIKLIAKSESESVLALAKDTSKIAILSRKLNPEEEKVFESKKITPRTTVFAIDAIAFISNNWSLTANEAEKFWPIYNAFEEKKYDKQQEIYLI